MRGVGLPHRVGMHKGAIEPRPSKLSVCYRCTGFVSILRSATWVVRVERLEALARVGESARIVVSEHSPESLEDLCVSDAVAPQEEWAHPCHGTLQLLDWDQLDRPHRHVRSTTVSVLTDLERHLMSGECIQVFPVSRKAVRGDQAQPHDEPSDGLSQLVGFILFGGSLGGSVFIGH